MKKWLSDWAWVLLIAVLILSAVILFSLKMLGVIVWPWWAALIPVYLLVALVGWALAGLDSMMRDNGWH